MANCSGQINKKLFSSRPFGEIKGDDFRNSIIKNLTKCDNLVKYFTEHPDVLDFVQGGLTVGWSTILPAQSTVFHILAKKYNSPAVNIAYRGAYPKNSTPDDDIAKAIDCLSTQILGDESKGIKPNAELIDIIRKANIVNHCDESGQTPMDYATNGNKSLIPIIDKINKSIDLDPSSDTSSETDLDPSSYTSSGKEPQLNTGNLENDLKMSQKTNEPELQIEPELISQHEADKMVEDANTQIDIGNQNKSSVLKKNKSSGLKQIFGKIFGGKKTHKKYKRICSKKSKSCKKKYRKIKTRKRRR